MEPAFVKADTTEIELVLLKKVQETKLKPT